MTAAPKSGRMHSRISPRRSLTRGHGASFQLRGVVREVPSNPVRGVGSAGHHEQRGFGSAVPRGFGMAGHGGFGMAGHTIKKNMCLAVREEP